MSDATIKWIKCVGYVVVVHRASAARPARQFRFTAFDQNRVEYVVDLTTAADHDLLRKVLRVIANRWPDKELEVRVDSRRIISDIRSPRE